MSPRSSFVTFKLMQNALRCWTCRLGFRHIMPCGPRPASCCFGLDVKSIHVLEPVLRPACSERHELLAGHLPRCASVAWLQAGTMTSSTGSPTLCRSCRTTFDVVEDALPQAQRENVSWSCFASTALAQLQAHFFSVPLLGSTHGQRELILPEDHRWGELVNSKPRWRRR